MFRSMKNFKYLFLVMFLILFVTSSGWTQKSYKDLKYPPLGAAEDPGGKKGGPSQRDDSLFSRRPSASHCGVIC